MYCGLPQRLWSTSAYAATVTADGPGACAAARSTCCATGGKPVCRGMCSRVLAFSRRLTLVPQHMGSWSAKQSHPGTAPCVPCCRRQVVATRWTTRRERRTWPQSGAFGLQVRRGVCSRPSSRSYVPAVVRHLLVCSHRFQRLPGHWQCESRWRACDATACHGRSLAPRAFSRCAARRHRRPRAFYRARCQPLRPHPRRRQPERSRVIHTGVKP